MYIRGLILRNFAELAEAVPIGVWFDSRKHSEKKFCFQHLIRILPRISIIYICLFDFLRPSHQFFSYVDTALPGLNQYLYGKDKCVLLNDTTQ